MYREVLLFFAEEIKNMKSIIFIKLFSFWNWISIICLFKTQSRDYFFLWNVNLHWIWNKNLLNQGYNNYQKYWAYKKYVYVEKFFLLSKSKTQIIFVKLFSFLSSFALKFGLSEKHTKFEKIFLMVLTNQLIY